MGIKAQSWLNYFDVMLGISIRNNRWWLKTCLNNMVQNGSSPQVWGVKLKMFETTIFQYNYV